MRVFGVTNSEPSKRRSRSNAKIRKARLVGGVLAGMVGDVSQGRWPEGSLQKLALHGIVGLIEAKIGGGGCEK